EELAERFAREYWGGDDKAFELPASVVPSGLTGAEAREAVRALAGRTLRTEVYALDGSELEGEPFTVSEGSFEVRQVQARGPNCFGVYLAHDREALSYHYERDPLDPRIAHSFTLEVDDYGAVLRSAAVAYPRREFVHEEQGATYVTLSEADVVHLVDGDDVLRLGVPVEARSYQVHGLITAMGAAFSWQAVREAADSAAAVAYDGELSGGVDKRLLSRSRTRYLADDLSAPLAHGVVQSKALVYDTDAMAMTETQRQAVFGALTG
ncbi:toxin TcdB middle/C-terminal domain-containing protein, partial [Enhygromyxa salina]|uniref:toxin TcdB middle/C-terminal domain-containing protein n=1 Tax=Enhygromyxa salina TaxID=215803 RepID=UPI00280AA593